ncbi:hypothetical protein TGAMA5MH_08846 [Trichoderma gamsii]|uniref:Zn(2)-C6 fungal-type domain-containing protein n=1 Tax=Trichoderma gamsii TaxID=398673 RepID=A0A2K0T0X6_9HYPO|nr:hypothetical protein TGAMA5MH_08846 [Trichoderma gamsii]
MPFSRQKSCTHCKQSKLRCNRVTPTCSRCAERNLLCDIREIHVSPYSASRGSKGLRQEPVDIEAIEYQQGSFNVPSAIFDEVTTTGAAITFDDDNVASNWMAIDSLETLNPKNLDSEIDSFGLEAFEAQFGPQIMSESGHSGENDIQTWTSTQLANHGNSDPISCWDSPSLLGESNPDGTITSCEDIPSTLAVRTPSNPESLRSRPILKGCMLTNIILGQITGYPKMLVLGDRLPPFIHAPCYTDERLAPECGEMGKHQCLPKSLAICASLVDMFYSRTDANADFVWQTIYSEGKRLHEEVSFSLLTLIDAIVVSVLTKSAIL